MELVNYYLKAIVGAVVAGLTYFMTVLAPTATLSDVTLVQWIGFAVSVLGTFAGVAAVTNGPKPGAAVEYEGRHEAGPLG